MPGVQADLVVIGGGPAGVSAALRARELGATVALVEQGQLGGTCTNDGCVPTRVLAKAARLIRDAAQFDRFGLHGQPPTVDLGELMAHTRSVIEGIHAKKDLAAHLEWTGVTVKAGTGPARFTDQHTLTLPDGSTVGGRHFLLSAGGHARRLPLPGGELVRTHSDIWSLATLPEAIAIVGGGATGCQLASVFAAFGSQVTLIDVAPELLAGEDHDVRAAMSAALASRGIRLATGVGGLEQIQRAGGRLRVTWGAGGGQGRSEQADVDEVVLAVGWPGNTNGMGLEAAGVRTERGFVVVDEQLRTTAPHIWAAGDITGRVMLVQTATADARLAVENAVLGAGRVAGTHMVPHGGFTDPEYASVGLTEAAARDAFGDEVAVATVSYAEMDRAVIDGHTEGFCKLLAESGSRRLVGAHVVGEQAVEIVQLVAAAIDARTPVEDVADLELAYPTFTAVIGLCARRLARELGAVAVSPQWRALGLGGLTEWERDGAGTRD
jgi:pyruvate/2-oxoglutarate dehydrogenase complex dihydrolipoamide dehydrogenase (E3) component